MASSLMIKKMKLSIITINYNNYDGLVKTMKSVLAQTCKDFEWIVIDGGSSDGSKDLIEQKEDDITYWCSEPDKGIYHAMNKGIARASGDYLQFLNSGDFLENDTVVKSIIPYLQDSDIYIANMYHSSRMGIPSVNPSSLWSQNILHTLVFKGVMHPASYIKKDCFERFGAYKEDFKIISDWWFFFKSIVLNNATVSYIPVVSVVFDESGISSTQPELSLKEKSELFRKYVPIGQLYSFYQENYDIIDTLKSNKFVFLLFRIYFFFHRKFK
jgi:glycosyltransferase involved in cell wall biosynthesis